MKKLVVVSLYLTLSYLVFFAPILKGTTILESGNDARRFSYPVRVYLSEKLSEGKFPFWTERMFSGYPIYADIEAGYLNPVNLLAVRLLGPYTSYKLIHYFSYLLGSACFLLFVRKYLKSWASLVVSHFIYFFSFFSLYHQQHFAITLSYYLFPCFLYLLDKFIATTKTRFVHLYLIIMFFLLYFGAFQMSVIILLISVIYLIFHKALTRELVIRSIFPILVFLCLLIPLISSYAGLYGSSARVSTKDMWLEGSFSPQVVLNLVYPFVYRYGNNYMGVILNRDFLMHEMYIYAGFSAVFLAFFGLIFSKLEKRFNKLLLIMVVLFVSLSFAKANPLLAGIDPPLIGLFRYWGRLVFLLIFAVSVYCGHFIDQLNSVGYKLRLNRKYLYFVLGCLGYLLILELLKFPNLETINLAKLLIRSDYQFDCLLPYLVFVFLTIGLLILGLKYRTNRLLKYVLFAVPVLELAFFGNMVLKGAFVSIVNRSTDLSNLEKIYKNQRIVVTDADVIGNKTLYYTFWSPFGYVASSNIIYDKTLKSMGFESSRRPIITTPILQSGLEKLGVIAVVNTAGRADYQNPFNQMFYTDTTATIQEMLRVEDSYNLQITFNDNDTHIRSYLRYDSGWKVVSNGIPVKVIRDGLFLGFNLPKGVSTVRIEYIPHIFYLSLIASIVGIIILMIVRLVLKKFPHSYLFLLFIAIFMALRLPGLGTDMLNSDGARWHRRTERFLTAIKEEDFASTYQHYQPGVTLMWINSATKKAVWEVQDAFKMPRWSLENAQDFPKIHAVSKTVLVAVLSLIFLYQMLLISKISSLKVALIYGLFVATEPYLIGIDRWFHLTSLESYLAFSAYLTYLYSFVRRDGKVFIVTGTLIALSTLSKLTGIIVLPLILFTETVRVYYSKNIRRSITTVICILASFAVTTLILFPALWVDFGNVVNRLIVAVSSAVDNDTRAQYFKPPFSYIYYLVILGFKLSPVTLMTFVGSLLVFVPKIHHKESPQGRLILAYFLTFFLALTLSSKKIDRYSLSLLQPLILFIALYLARLKNKALVIVIALQITVSAFTYYTNYPALSGYYSPIFGGTRSALNLGVYENSGEYFAQSAFYLNNKGSSDVYVPDNFESFKYFYQGNTLRDLSPLAKYIVTSVDFDRKSPQVFKGCEKLDRTFGPKNSISAVYIYECAN